MLHNITIYCASSRHTPQKYLDAALELADILIENNMGLVYGGGAVGLMGCLANRFLEKGGRVRGVIPEFMVKVEWAHSGVEDMHIVHNMAERKDKLMNFGDAIIALPGGTGTLEELVEVLALKRLGKFLKPIILLNTDGFYAPLIAFFETMVKERFLRREHLNAFCMVNHPSEVMDAIHNSPEWSEDAIDQAPV